MVSSDPAQVNIQVGGNVDGNIVVGDNNFVVNTNHGTIVYRQAAPQVRARQFTPQPPRPPRGFLNRAAELQVLESWISANEMVLIHGPDGMGKSSLIRQIANSSVGRAMPNGVILLEGVNINEDVLGPNDIIQRLFDAFFESVPPLKVDANIARTYLSNTRPLLLLDEVSLSPTLQSSLPDLFPNGAMIFTSDVLVGREDFLRLPLGPLQRDVAVRLLVNKSRLELNEQNKKLFDSLCALLGDISLAVVITGNVVRERGATLEDTLTYMEKISRSQHDGLDRAFAFAFSRLRPDEREMLSAAAFTPGVSMSSEWLVAACGSQEAEHCIERLKALGLLAANSPRLRLPPGIRIPAQRASILEEDIVLRRLSVFLLTSLELNAQNWGFFANELGNFFGALGWAVRNNHWTQALRLGLALDPYLTLRGYWDSWRDLLDVLLNAAREGGNRATEAFVLHQLGARAIGMGAPQQALDYLYQALQLRAQLGDRLGMAYTQHNIDFLIGPPPPSRNDQPGPQSPAPVAEGGMLPLAGGALAFLVILAIVALAILPPIFQPLPPTVTPSVTNIVADTPTSLPTPSLTSTPTATSPSHTPTPSPTFTPSPTYTQSPTLTPKPIVINFWSTEATIISGKCTDLYWAVQNANRVFLDSIEVSMPDGSEQVCPSTTTTYTLSAVSLDGYMERQVTVKAIDPYPPPAFTPSLGCFPWSFSDGATYYDPTMGCRWPVDTCLESGIGCGKPAADAWCDLYTPYKQARTWVIGPSASTSRYIGSGVNCYFLSCTSFKSITCDINQ